MMGVTCLCVVGAIDVSIFNNPTSFHFINAASVPDKAAILLLLFLLGLGFQEATAQQRGGIVGRGGRRPAPYHAQVGPAESRLPQHLCTYNRYAALLTIYGSKTHNHHHNHHNNKYQALPFPAFKAGLLFETSLALEERVRKHLQQP